MNCCSDAERRIDDDGIERIEDIEKRLRTLEDQHAELLAAHRSLLHAWIQSVHARTNTPRC